MSRAAAVAVVAAGLAGCAMPWAPVPGASPHDACRTVIESVSAAVRVLIAPDGTVVPGSPRILKSVGEPQVASAMEAAALSMAFDFDPDARPAAPVPFTSAMAVCPRS